MADSHQDDTATATLDIEAASARIGESLFGTQADTAEPPEETVHTQPPQPSPGQAAAGTPSGIEPPNDLLPPPKSWRQDMHPHWGKMPVEAQKYYVEREKQMLDGMAQYKQIQQVLEPFVPQLSERGITPYEWMRGLVHAERMLTQGTDDQRRAAYQKLGEQLGFAVPPQTEGATGTPIDPQIRSIQAELAAIKSGITAQQQAVYNDVRGKVQQEVDAFAADTKAHPYFDEVAEDLMIFLRQGLSLQDAYDRAVWANPATREKVSQQRLTDELAKQKENARLAALPKKKAMSVNVRSTDTNRTPTEPVGSLEDTIKAKLQEIRQRA